MILKFDALASMALLLTFLIASYPLLSSSYDLSGLKRLEEGCQKELGRVKNMGLILSPEKGENITIKLYDKGMPLDVIHVNGTFRWVVKVGCEGSDLP